MIKAYKYIAITLVIVTLLATLGWFARNTLIQRFSKSILSEFDIEIVDISLDALATSSARIGYLELVHAKGTTIVIEKLTLPINTPANSFEVYSAARVSMVTATRDDEEPLDLAQLIDQFLSLTHAIPLTEIRIGELRLAPYPVVRDLNWSLSEVEQSLAGSVESLDFSIVTTELDANSYQVSFSLPNQAGADGKPIVGRLDKNSEGIALTGDRNLELPSWEALSKLAGIVPDEVELKSGSANLLFAIEIPYDVMRSPALSASLTPTTPWQITYVRESGESTEIRLTSIQPAEITATFPNVEWSLQLAQASLLVTDGEWRDVPVFLSMLTCDSDLICSMDARISWSRARLPFGNAEEFVLSAALDVAFPDTGVHVSIAPEARVSLTKLAGPAVTMELFEATLMSAAGLEVFDTGWQLDADSVDTRVQSLSAGDSVQVTAPVFLENIRVRDLEQKLSTDMGLYTPAISAALNEQTVAVPGLRGKVSVTGADILFNLDTVGLQQNGTLTVRQNIDSGDGSMQIENAAVSFAAKKMSGRVSPWKYDWDLISGLTSIGMQATWNTNREDLALRGQGSIAVSGAAGFYTDVAFTGLSTSLEIGFATATGFATQPSSISVGLIEIGLPIENITADYSLDLNSLAADVENLRMTAFGGAIWADPFSFHTDRDSNNLVLHAEVIQLEEILSLKEFEAISVTGSIGATLPVTIGQEKVTIAGGSLRGDAPGGVIRYKAANVPAPTSASSMDLVTRALSNFVYETLSSEVDYNEAGDLILKMQLKGRNPDMEGNRPVILNLSVENNVPQMLRSLQAARAVEEVLEKRVKK